MEEKVFIRQMSDLPYGSVNKYEAFFTDEEQDTYKTVIYMEEEPPHFYIKSMFKKDREKFFKI
jgi:hypothetical protein